MYPNPFPFTLYNVTAETPTPPSPTGDYCYGGDWVQGKIDNYGMEFDGTDEYITTPSVSDIEFGNDSTFTVAFWVKSAQDSAQSFISKRVFNLANYGWTIGRDYSTLFGNNNKVFVTVSNGAGPYGLIVSDAVMDANWHHIAFTRDGATPGNTILYIDGVAQADTTMGGGSGTEAQQSQLADGGQPLYVGRYWHTTQATGYNLNGTIDDIGIWDVPLSASDITSLYNSGNGAVASSISSSNLLLYYDFEIGDSNPVSGNFPTSTTVYDASLTGSAHTGTMTNMAVADFGDWTQGKRGKYSLDFDGSDDVVTVASGSGLATGDTSKSFSVSAWVYQDTWTSWDVVIARKNATWYNGWGLTTDGSRTGEISFWFGGFSSAAGNKSYATISTGQWHHLVGTYDPNAGSNGQVQIWVDGVAQTAADRWVNASAGPDSGPLEIGEGWDGKIDDLATWDVVLDSGAISDLYNSGYGAAANSVSSSNITAYYNFEGGPGNGTLVDRSGNGHAGTLTNMSTGSCGAG